MIPVDTQSIFRQYSEGQALRRCYHMCNSCMICIQVSYFPKKWVALEDQPSSNLQLLDPFSTFAWFALSFFCVGYALCPHALCPLPGLFFLRNISRRSHCKMMVTIIVTISNNLNSLEVVVVDVFDDSNKSAISRSEVVSLDGANLAFI